MSPKQVTDATGIDRETLRFYEAKSLLPKAKRSSAGYRDYPVSIIDRIQFIKASKAAGFTLREIKDLIELKHKNSTCRTGRDFAIQKRQEIKNKMKALREMKKVLDYFIDSCNSNGEKGLNQKCHLSFDTIISEIKK